ncbi:GerA spore germination protein [Paenibacillus curdlanolyticus YK9]|uniref:GerA spore germination protein n=1 Tax=Paenibacillus curdlanolyticus YK9 TaxID=717606 RepID=E0I663_9BACL|nr:spore germination protein [Paenibacillus curdlanolyticus]EFM12455.1 GerA spore germination protein [Paenibacillus curdlanolyticus YK9]
MKACLSIEATEQYFNELFSEQSDYIAKSLMIGGAEIRLFYFDTLIDYSLVQEYILQPLLLRPNDAIQDVVSILDYTETDRLEDAGQAIMFGKAILLRKGENKLYLLGVDLKKERSINIPTNERVLRGPNEAFIENLDTNLNLMRKLISSKDFIVRTYTIGRLSQTKVAVMYIKSIANMAIIEELHKRLSSIDIDYVEAPGFIDELIREKKYSLFPQLLFTERPDRARSYLMEGKAVISTAGSPDAIILPVTFWSFFQSPDDYHSSWFLGTAFRFLRICCFFITIGLPAFYVSVNAFNPQLLPINFVNTLQSSVTNVTFPPVFEALSMILMLEILREATIRLASPIGQTIGVVGGIVIGTVVVQSNLVSNTMVIVAALTGLASFIMPSYEMSSAVRLLSYPALILSSLFGLLGLVFFFMVICIHLCQMNTMGIPYYSPPFSLNDAKDTLFRAPIWSMRKRPGETAPSNHTRLRNPRSWKR